MVIAQRENDLKLWLGSLFGHKVYELTPLAGDASFRRYFRVQVDGHRYVAMDAPPDKENCARFVAIAIGLNRHHINTPLIHHQNLTEGFLLLSDFGDAVYLNQLDNNNADALYRPAIDTLIRLQTCEQFPGIALTKFDGQWMWDEMTQLFDNWFLNGWLNLALTSQQQELLQTTYHLLITQAAMQPQVTIHRDYHSRNLMVTATNTPGVLDFQDAMIGPVSYDLVSLLRDCYIAWPQSRVRDWVSYYLQQAQMRDIINPAITAQEFNQWFDWMGIQRHLKAIGIFARLKLRDAKPNYLKDIPRTLNYITTVAQQYVELTEFYEFLQQYVGPQLR